MSNCKRSNRKSILLEGGIRLLLLGLVLSLGMSVTACGDKTEDTGDGGIINPGKPNSSEVGGPQNPTCSCTDANQVCSPNGECVDKDDPCAKIDCIQGREICQNGLCVPNCAASEQCNGICCGDGEECVALQCVQRCDDGRRACGDGQGGTTCCGADQVCFGQACVEKGPECDLDKEILCLIDEFCDEESGHCVKYKDAPSLCRMKPEISKKFETKLHWKSDDSIATPIVLDIDTSDNDPTPVIAFASYGPMDSHKGHFIVIKGTPKPGTTDPILVWRSDQLAKPFTVDFGYAPAAGIVDKASQKATFYAAIPSDTRYSAKGIIGINADGSVRFEHIIEESGIPSRPYKSRRFGALALADINADGKPEVVGFGRVLDADSGNLLHKLEDWNIEGLDIPVVADMNLDGYLDIVDGLRVYLFDKEAYKKDPSVFKMKLIDAEDGGSPQPHLHSDTNASVTSAVAFMARNMSTNPQIIGCGNHEVYVADWRGKIIDKMKAPDGGKGAGERGGPPTIADFDGDGQPEIGCAFASNYVVYEFDTTSWKLSEKWRSPSIDESSGVTGSTVFDFDGDGKVEVVYNDEQTIQIFNASTGEVILPIPNRTATLVESPVVADVDNDGHADMIAVSNNGSPGGLRVFQGEKNKWAPTRPLWNQHTYNVVNINKDGTIPQKQRVNALQRWLNNFRQNIQPGEANLAPNLIVEADSLTAGDCSGNATMPVTFRIKNVGDKAVPAKSVNSAVLVYLDDNTNPELPPYKIFPLQHDLQANDAQAYTFDFQSKVAWSGKKITLEFVADYDNSIQECKKDDNTARLVDVSAARPDLHASIENVAYDACQQNNGIPLKITLENRGDVVVPAQQGKVTIYRKIGSGVEEKIATVSNQQDLAKGTPEVIEYLDAINPNNKEQRNKQITYRIVVDEENKILECTEGDDNVTTTETICQVLG